MSAGAVVLATGTRERSRAARLIPGTRPLGVMTTGALQQLVAFQRAIVGSRAVVVGAEHVSFSAVLTLSHGGCRTVAIVTEHPHHQTASGLRAVVASARGIPIRTGVRVEEILGRRRVEGVRLSDGSTLACDTVVFTGNWVPDDELARRGGITIDPATHGPAVDASLRTSATGVFAAGNLLHGAETADACALEGRHVARSVVEWLTHATWPAPSVPIVAQAPVVWVAPNRVSPDVGRTSRRRVLMRVGTFPMAARVTITQGERVLWTGRPDGALVPNRSIHVPDHWMALVDPAGPPVVVALADLR
jgi:pyruvate/2-oxoglutarate dehydrogenase complex dihydrolipoamide dehydrogenase (E3) component